MLYSKVIACLSLSEIIGALTEEPVTALFSRHNLSHPYTLVILGTGTTRPDFKGEKVLGPSIVDCP